MKRQRTDSAMREADAAGITMTELRNAFASVIVDGYHDAPHGGIGATPLEEWADRAARYGKPRPWPSDAAAALRLDHLRLIYRGTRDRTHGHYRVDRRDYIPFRPGMPDVAHVFQDPEHPELISLYESESREAGTYRGDAYVSGTLHVSYAPSDEAEEVGGQAVINDVVARLDRPHERPRAAARRQRQADTKAARKHRPSQPAVEAPAPIKLTKRRGFAA
jgi:hypothetical protein